MTLPERKEWSQFLSRCAEFLDYVVGDCQGLSPGLTFFEQSASGLRYLASKIPEHTDSLAEAANIYDTLAREAPKAMYPRGSQMFSDLNQVEKVGAALYEISDQLAERRE